MSNFLEKIREKPEQQRYRILIASTIILTALIVLVWISFLYARYLSSSREKKNIQFPSSPFEVFFKDLSERAESVKNGYKSVTDIISEVTLEADPESFSVSSSSEGASSTGTPEILSPSEEQ